MSDTNSAGTNVDVVDILTSDHQDMIALIGQIKGAPNGDQRRDLADTLIAEVMRHAVAEEMYVYPAVEDHVPNGKEEVEHDKKEHDEIVKLMKRLEKADSSDQEFMELVHELEGQLTHHASDEETEQFPKLRLHIPREKLVEIGGKVEKAKKLAPTRPHPSAPHSELFHKTVGPGVGMVDRLLDKLTGRHTGS
ncbi:hemerythrin domain-containing protein [Pseudarthrobacter phenanthrenivorans]|uniref:Hemerythrin domain-containing protein n=2 Tax=Pseudarthrobacter phenanthrenivorans TaxID=361575 RepID=A0A3B0FV18_PSEPS|nr:hemerythrin domain-containing protein [Pseudarthrobacter phenanthrenivorans]ADX71359.1 hemerythrin HHE cation binding domain-containing protein [Pseudarthrobacter phenanthrenivorans Sphe3]RKO23488.1 hemerythrin domain-containing protein [Pseudarthrobacter phenanthrenivorans]TPV51029.1 hemerythrin domain-containing protein [Pseudarthrobacter phenanthrenivorans]